MHDLPGSAPVSPSAAEAARAQIQTPLRYRAFISYSHSDARWASWLHRGLEGYRVPSRLRGTQGEFGPLPDRLIPIFRDREDLASAGELGPRIQSALAESEALIVVCSPEAAQSPWVNEEIIAFKRLRNASRIYCLIVAGEPHAGDGRECFPKALRFELDADGKLGTRPAEPIAADIRPGKDGKSLARLKLLSGLLGVGLDTLRQREAARRQRRLLAITALALLVMLVTSYLAVQAVIAQRAAERRQKQAEQLVDFMLGDLTDKLQQVSRLDILEAVDDKAMGYFSSLPDTDVTDQALEQRAKALQKIGNVRLDQGQLPQALASYHAAAALTGKLSLAQPANVERQLAHAENLAFIGTANWYQGELGSAQTGFEAAQRVLLRAKTIAPDNSDLLFQLCILDNNIGHVLESQGNLSGATTQYKNMLASCQVLATLDAKRAEWVTQLGLAHNNIAKMALLNGDLTSAVSEYRTDVEIERTLADQDKQNNAQAEKLALSQGALGRTLGLTADVDGGIAILRQALDGVVRLRQTDLQNTSYAEDVALYSCQLARLLRLRGNPEAGSLVQQSLSRFDALTKQNPQNAPWQREFAEARIEKAEQARVAGRDDDARNELKIALTVLEPQLAEQPQDRSTVLATNAARLHMAAISEDNGVANALREKARDSLESQSSGLGDPRLQALIAEAKNSLETSVPNRP